MKGIEMNLPSLFSTETSDGYDTFLPVCSEYLERHPIPDIAPNPELFSPESLSGRPGMEWLQGVSCLGMIPPSREVPEQDAALDIFLQELKKETYFLPRTFSAAFQEGDTFQGANFLSLDLETTGLDTRVLYSYEGDLLPKTEIVGVSIGVSETKGYYLPVMHTEADGIPNWNKGAIVRFLQKVCDTFLVVYHNAQYDKEVLALNGVAPRPFPFFLDTQLLHFLTDVNSKRHGLKVISAEMLGRKMLEISELFTELGVKTKQHINFDHLPYVNAYVYACSDAINTFALVVQFMQVPAANNVFTQQPVPLMIDHKVVDVVRNMYRPGFPVNLDFAIQSCKDILWRLKVLERKAHEFVGTPFDIQSPQQISVLLFDTLKLPVLESMERGKPTKNYPQGLYSTAADVLEALYEKHPDIPILKYIVEYRQLAQSLNNVFLKLVTNSYVDAYLPYTRSQAQYSLTVIPTGRLSSASNDGREGVICNITDKGNVTYHYHKGSWACGFNTQGVPKPDKKMEIAMKLAAIPPEAGIDLTQAYPKELQLEFLKLIAQV